MPLGWRSDGRRVRDLAHTRRIMPYLMRRKSESVVFFEQKVDTGSTWPFLHDFRRRTGLRVTFLHLLILALTRTLDRRPRLNRFVAGRRIFQRHGIWVSFSAKKGPSEEEPIFVVKRRIDPSWSLETVVRVVDEAVDRGRSAEPSPTDRELALLFHLPSILVDGAARLAMLLDSLGWLPGFFLREDPFFASAFIANLGSIGIDAGFHHLYEYGNIPIFLTVGRRQPERILDEEGGEQVRPMVTIRISFDERVEDALYAARALELFRTYLEEPGRLLEGLPDEKDEP